MDKIIIEGMDFFGYHGVLPEEQKLGQRFVIDVILKTDLRKAGCSDDLDQTVNYAEVYTMVKHIVEEKCFKLIEALAEHIAQEILDGYPVNRVKVKVYKPQAPIPGIFKTVAVQISREKQHG